MKVDSLLKIGQEVTSGYKLRSFRGRGGCGTVWEAANDDGDALAVKVSPCPAGMTAAREIRTLQAIKQLRHPNLIRIEDVWCDAGNVGFSMELADGSLVDLMEAYQSEYGTVIDAEEACLYLTQAARAIDYLNARQHNLDGRRVGFQHGAIKASNLLLFGEVLKIADLRLALPAATTPFVLGPGTVDYAAPELLQGRISEWSDQYALAVTYCQLRGGRMPFPAVPENWARTFSRPAPDLSMLTEKERPVIVRALSLVPQQRWPSCGEMMTRLGQATAPERRRSEALAGAGSGMR